MRKKMAIIIGFILVMTALLFNGCGHADNFRVPNDVSVYCNLVQVVDGVWVDQKNGVLYFKHGYGMTPLLYADGTPKNLKDFQGKQTAIYQLEKDHFLNRNIPEVTDGTN